jgi:hypothetical protein
LTGPLTVSAVWLLGAFTPPSLFSMASIVADEDVFLQFKEESKKQYSRSELKVMFIYEKAEKRTGSTEQNKSVLLLA